MFPYKLLLKESLIVVMNDGFYAWYAKVKKYLAKLFVINRYYCYKRKAKLTKFELDNQRQYWSSFNVNIDHGVFLSLIVPTYNPCSRYISELVESIIIQTYPYWELLIINDSSTDDSTEDLIHSLVYKDKRIRVITHQENRGISEASNTGLKNAKGKYVLFIDHDDLLYPEALDYFSKVINCNPTVDMVYCDEEIGAASYLSRPNFKPDYSPTYLLQAHYICHTIAYRRQLLLDLGGLRKEYDGSQDHDLALRVTEHTNNILHIPRILYFWRTHINSFSYNAESRNVPVEAGRRAVIDALDRRGINAAVENDPLSGYRVLRRVHDCPKISIIIPMRDNLDMLKKLIISMEAYKTYNNYEVLIIDNTSQKEETTDYLSDISRNRTLVKIIKDDGDFNISRLINRGATEASGEILLLLKNDTEVIHDNWLEFMLGHIHEPDVGAVGALITHPDGSIQHLGVIVEKGEVNHAFKYLPTHKFVNWWQDHAIRFDREVSAVTATCMMIRRTVYIEVGGMDETHFKVDFNDVDLCLRLRQEGFRIIVTPKTKIIHHESKSRGNGIDKSELNYMKHKWTKATNYDPYYNPNISSNKKNMGIGKPWFMQDDNIPALDNRINLLDIPGFNKHEM